MARGYAWSQVEQTDAIWQRLRAGMAAKPAARELGISAGTVWAYLMRCGGIQPAPRRRRAGYLTLLEREEISHGLAAGWTLRVIAAQLGRAPSTISREVARKRRAARLPGAARGPGGVVTGDAAEAVQARGAAWAA